MVKDFSRLHFMNLMFFGIFPALILKLISPNFKIFADYINTAMLPGILIAYFGLMYALVLFIYYSGLSKHFSNPQSIALAQSIISTFRSICYFAAGSSFISGLFLVPFISSYMNFAEVIGIVLGGSLFLFGPSYIVILAPESIRPKY